MLMDAFQRSYRSTTWRMKSSKSFSVPFVLSSLLNIVMGDQYQYLGNSAPTPPLTQHSPFGSSQDTDIDPTWLGYYSFNPLTPKSDQHQISHYIITTESHIMVRRIKEMITNLRSPRLLNQFSLPARKET